MGTTLLRKSDSNASQPPFTTSGTVSSVGRMRRSSRSRGLWAASCCLLLIQSSAIAPAPACESEVSPGSRDLDSTCLPSGSPLEVPSCPATSSDANEAEADGKQQHTQQQQQQQQQRSARGFRSAEAHRSRSAAEPDVPRQAPRGWEAAQAKTGSSSSSSLSSGDDSTTLLYPHKQSAPRASSRDPTTEHLATTHSHEGSCYPGACLPLLQVAALVLLALLVGALLGQRVPPAAAAAASAAPPTAPGINSPLSGTPTAPTPIKPSSSHSSHPPPPPLRRRRSEPVSLGALFLLGDPSESRESSCVQTAHRDLRGYELMPPRPLELVAAAEAAASEASAATAAAAGASSAAAAGKWPEEESSERESRSTATSAAASASAAAEAESSRAASEEPSPPRAPETLHGAAEGGASGGSSSLPGAHRRPSAILGDQDALWREHDLLAVREARGELSSEERWSLLELHHRLWKRQNEEARMQLEERKLRLEIEKLDRKCLRDRKLQALKSSVDSLLTGFAMHVVVLVVGAVQSGALYVAQGRCSAAPEGIGGARGALLHYAGLSEATLALAEAWCFLQAAGELFASLLGTGLVAFVVLTRGYLQLADSMPFTVVILMLGLFCGWGGQMTVEAAGGKGGTWLGCWVAWVLLHLAARAASSGPAAPGISSPSAESRTSWISRLEGAAGAAAGPLAAFVLPVLTGWLTFDLRPVHVPLVGWALQQGRRFLLWLSF